MRVAKVNQISPDGVPITLPWDEVEYMQSFFVPCIDYLKAMRQIKKQAAERKIKVSLRESVERDRFGVRVWRLA